MSLTSDGWTSNANVSYTTYTAQHVYSNWKLQSCVLETSSFLGSHTADRIKQHALNASENFGITGRVGALVHDEAANMEAASRALREHHQWASVTCAAHRLQTAIGHSFNDIKSIDSLLAKSRKQVVHFGHGAKATEELL